MSLEEIETALDKEWEVESGFFSKLRQLNFDEAGAERVISLLEQLHKTSRYSRESW